MPNPTKRKQSTKRTRKERTNWDKVQALSAVAAVIVALLALLADQPIQVPSNPTDTPTSTIASATNTSAPIATPEPTETLTNVVETSEEQALLNVATTDNILVGAYWYPWYGPERTHWREGYQGAPLLGEYSSGDANTIDQQIEWAVGNGVDFFAASWWGRNSAEDANIRLFNQSSLSNQIGVAVIYESAGRLIVVDGEIDFTNEINRSILISDMDYLARNFFTNSNYLHVDNRPVIFLYLSRTYGAGIEQALEQARQQVKDAIGLDMFIVGDEVYWHAPDTERIANFDGITSYSMHSSTPGIAINFAANVDAKFRAWSTAAEQAGAYFIPSVMPGFDKSRYQTPNLFVIPRSPSNFENQLRNALNLSNGDIKMLMITSWNEWHEYTAIEPSNEYGFAYLEILKEVLEEQKTSE